MAIRVRTRFSQNAAATGHFRGKYTSLANLQGAVPSANDGDYATVDAGIGTDVVEYIWDSDDDQWVQGGGSGGEVEDQIVNGVTDKAPSQNAVFDALNVIGTVSITGAITLDATAFGFLHILSGTAANYTVGLPTAVGYTGQIIAFKGSAALTRFVTIDGNSTETIDGVANKVVWSQEYIQLQSDGANWRVMAYRKRALVASMRRSSNQGTIVGSLNPTKIILNQSDIDNSGRMVDTVTNNRIDIIRGGEYRISFGLRYESLTGATVRCLASLSISGTPEHAFEIPGYTTATFPYPNGSLVRDLAAGAYLELYAFHSNASNQTITGAASAGSASFLAAEEIVE